jgi:hypothetical protein
MARPGLEEVYQASALPFAFPPNTREFFACQLPEQTSVQQLAQYSTWLGGKGIYSKEQWDIQKPVIRQLYNVENKPYKRVMEILRNEYNFSPT